MHVAGFLFALLLLCFEVSFAAPRFAFETTPYVSPRNSGLIEEAFQAAVRDVAALPPRTGNPYRSRLDRVVQVQLTTPWSVNRFWLT